MMTKREQYKAKREALPALNQACREIYETRGGAINAVIDVLEKVGLQLESTMFGPEWGIYPGQTHGELIAVMDGSEVAGVIRLSLYRFETGRYELTAYFTI